MNQLRSIALSSLDTGTAAESYESCSSSDPLERDFLLHARQREQDFLLHARQRERAESAALGAEMTGGAPTLEITADPEWGWHSCCALAWPLAAVCTVACLIVIGWLASSTAMAKETQTLSTLVSTRPMTGF